MTTDVNTKKRPTTDTTEPVAKRNKVEAPKAEAPQAEASSSVPIWDQPMAKAPVKAKKKRAPRFKPVNAAEISMVHHVHIAPKKKNSYGGYLSGVTTNSTNGSRVYVQINGGSIHPTWGYDNNVQYGKKYLKVSLPAELEENLKKFDDDYHKEMASRGFIKGATTPKEVANTVASLTKAGELKNDDKPEEGYWPRTIKVTIPTKADGTPGAKIVDEDGNVIPEENYESLNGREVISMIVMPKFIYYKGKNEAGFATDLVSIVVGQEAGDADPSEFDAFMPNAVE